jgi:hypothetical protein
LFAINEDYGGIERKSMPILVEFGRIAPRPHRFQQPCSHKAAPRLIGTASLTDCQI